MSFNLPPGETGAGHSEVVIATCSKCGNMEPVELFHQLGATDVTPDACDCGGQWSEDPDDWDPE